jgi:hypothetical protein
MSANTWTRVAGRLLWRAAAIALVLCSSLAIQAAELKLPPVDEAWKDPSLVTFRKGMLAAVKRRDVKYVIARAARDIKLSFGGYAGRKTFREWLTVEDLRDVYWQELEAVFSLGGVFTGKDTFCTPYVACVDVPGCPDCDPYEMVFVVSNDATVYTAMTTASPVMAHLSYNVLRMDFHRDVDEGWLAVELPDGRVGYATGPDFRMAVDHRALLRKRKGVWQIAVFVAGD